MGLSPRSSRLWTNYPNFSSFHFPLCKRRCLFTCSFCKCLWGTHCVPGQCKGDWSPRTFFTRLPGARGESLTTESFALCLAHSTRCTDACYYCYWHRCDVFINIIISHPLAKGQSRNYYPISQKGKRGPLRRCIDSLTQLLVLYDTLPEGQI